MPGGGNGLAWIICGLTTTEAVGRADESVHRVVKAPGCVKSAKVAALLSLSLIEQAVLAPSGRIESEVLPAQSI